jgi:Holliday junction DNA helicase RuvA
MIGRLAGVVDSVDEATVLIDVGGVGYVATCSSRTLGRLEPGTAAVLYIETHVREDAIQLFGFADREERRLFRLLTAIQGVGPKAALAILGVLPAAGLAAAVATGDRAAISRAPGVGAKLAARIVSELADRIGAGMGLPAAAAPATAAPATAAPGTATAVQDAVSALVNLGFRPADAAQAVGRCVRRLGPDAAVEALIRGSLQELTQQEPALGG